METVSWGELKTKNAVQIQVAAGVRLSHQQSAETAAKRTEDDISNLNEHTQELWVSLLWITCLFLLNTLWFLLNVCLE